MLELHYILLNVIKPRARVGAGKAGVCGTSIEDDNEHVEQQEEEALRV